MEKSRKQTASNLRKEAAALRNRLRNVNRALIFLAVTGTLALVLAIQYASPPLLLAGAGVLIAEAGFGCYASLLLSKAQKLEYRARAPYR